MAWATDSFGNDVTGTITVDDVTPCDPAATFCNHCTPSQMTLGTCLDGNYTFKYTATSLSGLQTTSLLIKFIVESYNTTSLAFFAGFYRTEYAAMVQASVVQYDRSLLNKLVLQAMKVGTIFYRHHNAGL